jgi:hypothetical protein
MPNLVKRLEAFKASCASADAKQVRELANDIPSTNEEAAAFYETSSHDTAAAAEAMAAARKRRDGYGHISIAEIAPFMRAPSTGRTLPDGCLVLLEDMKGGVARDGHGRPVVWSIGMQHGTAVEMQRQMLYIMERVAAHALPGMPPHATCMVIDIAPRDKGAPATFRFPDRDVRTLFGIQADMLPGAAFSTTHFCGLPTFVTFAFRLVKPFMSTAAYESMVLKPSHSHLPKHDLPEASRLPHWANGTFEFDVDEYIEWRAKEEGIDLKTLCARGNGRAFNAKAAAAAAAAALKESMGGGEGAAAIEVITAKALIEGDADAGASAVKHGGVSKRGSGRGLFSTTRWKRKLLVLVGAPSTSTTTTTTLNGIPTEVEVVVGAQAGQGAILVYFDDLTVSDSNKAAALIPLDAAASVEVCTADGRGPAHQWMLRAAGREYLFGVESEAEAEEWVEAVKAQMVAVPVAEMEAVHVS